MGKLVGLALPDAITPKAEKPIKPAKGKKEGAEGAGKTETPPEPDD